jgi:hypothetical protein
VRRVAAIRADSPRRVSTQFPAKAPNEERPPVGGSRSVTRVHARPLATQFLPANRPDPATDYASRDVARVVAEVSVLCPRAGVYFDNRFGLGLTVPPLRAPAHGVKARTARTHIGSLSDLRTPTVVIALAAQLFHGPDRLEGVRGDFGNLAVADIRKRRPPASKVSPTFQSGSSRRWRARSSARRS